MERIVNRPVPHEVIRVVERRVEVPYDVPVPYIETVQVPHEVIRTVEIPVPVEQLVEKVVERIVQVPVPVTRQEHVTRQVMSNTMQHVRSNPVNAPTQFVPGQDFGVHQGVVSVAQPSIAQFAGTSVGVPYGAAPVTAYGAPVTGYGATSVIGGAYAAPIGAYGAAPVTAYGAAPVTAYGAPMTGYGATSVLGGAYGYGAPVTAVTAPKKHETLSGSVKQDRMWLFDMIFRFP